MDRLLRSVLYMPGSNQRAMDKARELPCDAVIFDLEDAVAPDVKNQAREQVLQQLSGGGYGRRALVVRANSIDSPWGEQDLVALAEAQVETICLPKVDSPAQLQRSLELLDRHGAGNSRVWGMIETPAGVASVEDICASAERLDALLMGTTDLAHQLRLPPRRDRLGLLYALSKCVNAARMHNKLILDSVFLDIRDPDAFRADCEQGHALGFDGKTLIHPTQVEIANEIFGISEQQIEHAHRVLEAWQAAEREGKGVAVLDGKLVETMHVDEAQRLINLEHSLQEMEK